MSSRLLRNVSEAAPAGAAPAAGDAAKRRALRDPVLFVVSTLGIGGSERKIVRLANALSARGRRVALAYLNEPDALAAELDSAVPADNLRRKGKFSIAALHRLHTLIELHGARAVISVNLYPTLYTGLLARLSRRSQHVRFIASLNTTDLGERTQKQMLLYRPALRAMDELIFGAEHQRRLWSARQLQGRSPPSRVLYNGVDTEYFDRTTVPAWRPPDWPRNRRVIGAVGMLRAEKSHDHLLRAVQALHRSGLDVGVVLVGEGGQRAALHRLADELDLSGRVHMAGAVRDVRPYLAGFDLFVLTSTAVETFSNAALEALAMGVPVLSSRIGGMPEMLSEGGGSTYESGEIGALVAKLQEALDPGADLLSRWSRRAREVAQTRFSMQRMVVQFEEAIDAADSSTI